MIGGLISIVLAFVYFFGAGLLMRMFFAEEEIVSIGVSIMHVIIFVVILQIAQVIYMGCLRGAGDTFHHQRHHYENFGILVLRLCAADGDCGNLAGGRGRPAVPFSFRQHTVPERKMDGDQNLRKKGKTRAAAVQESV